ncbi:MAG TPA: MFS transporter [Rhizomicrobium sp.]|nr:MFS transporter [Rhizomicrobium sp.]
MDADLTRSTIRIVTWRLIPLLLLAYLAAYVDRINIGFAGAALKHDFGFSNTVFGFGAGLFFISYFLFEVPSNLLLAKFGARRWIARIMVTWGLLSAAMVFVQGPYSFYLVRFLLGFAEAGFFPGVIYYLVCWFPGAYRARMMALFTAGIPLSTVIGAPLSSQLLKMSGIAGLPGWQWMFLLEGLPAVAIGILVFFALPDRSRDATFLSPAQKQWLETTLAAEPERYVPAQFLSTLKSFYNLRVVALCLIYFANISANLSLAFFLPQIIASTGTSLTATGWLTALPSAVGVLGLVAIGWLSDHFANHRALLLVSLLITAVGFFAAAQFGAGGASAVGLGALAFASIGIHGLKAPFWSLAPITLAGPAAAGGIAWINSVGNLGGFFGPTILGWLTDTFGTYRAGIYALAAVQLAVALLAMCILRPEKSRT